MPFPTPTRFRRGDGGALLDKRTFSRNCGYDVDTAQYYFVVTGILTIRFSITNVTCPCRRTWSKSCLRCGVPCSTKLFQLYRTVSVLCEGSQVFCRKSLETLQTQIREYLHIQLQPHVPRKQTHEHGASKSETYMWSTCETSARNLSNFGEADLMDSSKRARWRLTLFYASSYQWRRSTRQAGGDSVIPIS